MIGKCLTNPVGYTNIRNMSKYHDADLAQMPNLFKALANPHRLQIFMRLASRQVDLSGGSDCDGQICACVGALGRDLSLAPSTVSHHIKVLAQAGLIKMTRRGQMVECQVDPVVVRILADYFLGLVGSEP